MHARAHDALGTSWMRAEMRDPRARMRAGTTSAPCAGMTKSSVPSLAHDLPVLSTAELARTTGGWMHDPPPSFNFKDRIQQRTDWAKNYTFPQPGPRGWPGQTGQTGQTGPGMPGRIPRPPVYY